MILRWFPYDEAALGPRKGVYLWLLRPLDHAPMYVGTTSKGFQARFKEHEDFFHEGLRGYFRRPFFENLEPGHRSFIARWHEIVATDPARFPDAVFVPDKGSSDPRVLGEGVGFWTDGIARLVCPVEEASPADIEPLEARLQYDLEDYYRGLLGEDAVFKVPRTRSVLFGRRERRLSEVAGLRLGHAFGGREFASSAEFFAALPGLLTGAGA